MKIQVTVQKVKKPFKIVFMRSNIKLSDSEEFEGKFTFDKNIVKGEIVSCETWKLDGRQISSEKLTFQNEEGEETTNFPFNEGKILEIVQALKEAGQSGLIIKAA